MKNPLPSSALLLLLWFPAQPLAAQIFSPGDSASDMDNARSSARAAAMGSAFVGVADDATAILSNPAGLAWLERGEFSVHSNFWLVNILEETAVLGIPAGSLGSFGLAGTYVDYGTIQGRDLNGDPIPSYSANRLELGTGWAKEMVKGLSFGGSLRVSQTTLEHDSSSLFAADLGLLLQPQSNVRLGLSAVNIGIGKAAQNISTAVNLGASYKFAMDRTGTLMVCAGGVIEPEAVNYGEAGGEFVFEGRYAVRAGFRAPIGGNGLEGLTGLTCGAGIALADFVLDYAYLPYGDLGVSHRVSLSCRFAQAPPAPEAKQAPVTVYRIVTQPAPAPTPQPQQAPQPAQAGSKDSMTIRFDFSSEALVQARDLENQGRFQEAVKAYQEILKADPENLQAWASLGALYFKFKQKEDAIRCYEHLLKAAPDNQKLSEWLQRYRLSP